MPAFPLELIYPFAQASITLHPTVIQDGDETYLIDCGYENVLPLLTNALAEYNLTPAELTGLLLSHDDLDHVGGLFELKAAYPELKLYASRTEAPYLSGEQKSLRLKQAEELFPQLPEAHRAWALDFQESLRAIKRLPIDVLFEADTAFSERIWIIGTPGHTPGHVSIYLPAEKLLVANDAVVVENGALVIANPDFTLDLAEAVRSVAKLAALDIDTLICYHGGVVTEDIPGKLRRLLERYHPPG